MNQAQQEVHLLTIQSDLGVIVAYDPTQMQHRVKSPSAWYAADPFTTEEHGDGRYAAWPIGKVRGQREWRVRLGASLSEIEQGYLRGTTPPSLLRIAGSEVFVGPAERLPGDGFGKRISIVPLGGGLLPLEPGDYAVRVHVLDWRPDDRFWTEENEPTGDAPPDFVLVCEPCGEERPTQPEPSPLLDLLPKKQATASKQVEAGSTWRSRHRSKVDFDEKPKRKRGSGGGGTRTRAQPKPKKITVRPGEMCVGATVRHPHYGVGEVLFVKEGFPKAKVDFQGHQEKVDKSELTVVS